MNIITKSLQTFLYFFLSIKSRLLIQDSCVIMGACRRMIAEHMIAGLFVTVLLQTCSAARNPFAKLPSSPDAGILQAWNYSGMSASLFRNDSLNIAQYFDIWPENATDQVKFTYYCEDPKFNLSLSNFTYTEYGGRLVTGPYYDLGIVENFAMPYWRHWVTSGSNSLKIFDTKRISYPINCEYNDLLHLYAYRLWHLTMLQGFVAFMVMQGVVMHIVFITMTLRWRGVVMDEEKDKKWKKWNCWLWPWSRDWGHFFSELIHLLLVVENGYCMMEAVGHSSLRTWRAMVMYKTGILYTWLTWIQVMSAIFRQVTNGWQNSGFVRLPKEDMSPSAIKRRKWFSLQDISDDWRWQRVFGQLGVLVLTSTFLTFVDDGTGGGMDQIAALVLAAAVVACIWSFGVSALVLFRFIRILALAVVDILKKTKITPKIKDVIGPQTFAKHNLSPKRHRSSSLRYDLSSSLELGRPLHHQPNSPSPRQRVSAISSD